MNRHLYYFTVATGLWMVYFLLGLPSDYFQRWTPALQFWVVVALPTAALATIGWLRFRRLPRRDALALATLMAFHFTVPLAAYDWLYLGMYRGLGASFVYTHWNLSVFYVIPWMLLPPLAWLTATGPIIRGGISDQTRGT